MSREAEEPEATEAEPEAAEATEVPAEDALSEEAKSPCRYGTLGPGPEPRRRPGRRRSALRSRRRSRQRSVAKSEVLLHRWEVPAVPAAETLLLATVGLGGVAD